MAGELLDGATATRSTVLRALMITAQTASTVATDFSRAAETTTANR